jgi:hypothetical protein
LLDDLAFEVLDQIAEADRVTTRWVMTGSTAAATCASAGSRSSVYATG